MLGFHGIENWRRRRESNPPKSDRQSGALPRGLQRHIKFVKVVAPLVHRNHSPDYTSPDRKW
jgi:hypothetical protein